MVRIKEIEQFYPRTVAQLARALIMGRDLDTRKAASTLRIDLAPLP